MTWALLKVFGAGAWGVAKRVWGLLPPKVWAVVIAALALVIYHLFAVHAAHKAGFTDGFEAANQQCEAREAERKAAQEQADHDAQDALDHAQTMLAQQQLYHQEEFAAQQKAAAVALADAKGRMPAYVSTLRLPAADTPRGYLLWRSAAAAFANGIDLPAAAKPPDGSLDGPSGVPLATVAETDLAQAAAYRDTVTWGRAWQLYAFDVKASCESTLSILKGKS